MLSVETLLIWRTLYIGNLSLTVLSFLSKKVPLQLFGQFSHSSNPDDSYFGKYGLLDFQPLYSPPPPLPYLCHQSLLHQQRLPGLDPWRVKPHGARLAVQSSRRRCLEGSPGQMPTPKLSVVSLLWRWFLHLSREIWLWRWSSPCMAFSSWLPTGYITSSISGIQQRRSPNCSVSNNCLIVV